MPNRSILYSDLWLWYRLHDNLKDQILHCLDLPKHLPLYTEDMQVEVLTGAPEDILKRHLKLIKPAARKKLGLTGSEEKNKVKTWSYGSLL